MYSEEEADLQNNQAQPSSFKVEGEKRILQISAAVEKFQLNGISFELKSHAYHNNMLLNGVTFDMSQEAGQARYQQHMRLIDSTSILLYNGVSLLDYNISGKSYKHVREVENLELLSHHQEMHTGRMYLGVLSRKSNAMKIQILDFLSGKTVFEEVSKALSLVQIVEFFVCFSKRNYYLTIYESEGSVYAEARVTNRPNPEAPLKLCCAPSNLHFNCDLEAFVFSRSNEIYTLSWRSETSYQLEQKKLTQFDEEVLFCRSYDNVVVVATRKRLHIRHLDVMETQSRLLQDLVEEYACDNIKVNCMEFKNNVLLISFQQIPVIWRFAVHDNSKITEIPFSSVNFRDFTKILIDPTASVAFLVSSHIDTQTADNHEDLSLGSPRKIPIQSYKMSISKVTLLHLNILNSIYALQHLPWQSCEYINVMGSLWSNDYFLHSKYKIATQNWSFGIEEALCSSVHPLCLFIAIGFRDCFKVFAVLSEGLSSINSGFNLRDCLSISYSSSGHHLAVCSSSTVHIYNSYSYEKLLSIPSIQNLPIRQLSYEQDILVVKCRNGNCFLYSNTNYEKIVSFYPKDYVSPSERHMGFEVVEYDAVWDVFVCSWMDQLKFYSGGGTVEMAAIKMGVTVTAVHISKEMKTMFLGTSKGEVICFPWPNNPLRLKLKQPKKRVHQDAIQFIRVRNDLKEIVITSAKGGLFIGKLRIIDQLRQRAPEDIRHQNLFKISTNDILKQHRLVFHSLPLSKVLISRAKLLEEQINNDNLTHPIEEEKLSNIGATRLAKFKESLAQKNSTRIMGLQKQHLAVRMDIRATREKMETSQSSNKRVKESRIEGFVGEQEQQGRRHRWLEKEFCRVKEQNKKEIQDLRQSYQRGFLEEEEDNLRVIKEIERKMVGRREEMEKTKDDATMEGEELGVDFQLLSNQTLDPLVTGINQLNSDSFDLMTQNSKLQKQINILQLKIKDLKGPLTDLESKISKPKHSIVQEFQSKQGQISELSNTKMKEKEFTIMKILKDVVEATKNIEYLTSNHQSLVEDVAVREEYDRELEKRIARVQEEIVDQKATATSHATLQPNLQRSILTLKKKKKELAERTLNCGTLFRREIEKLTILLRDNRVGELGERPSVRRIERMNTELPPDTPLRASSGNKPQRFQTQLKRITKAFYAYQRVGNTMTSTKKIFDNRSIRAYEENQDLVEHLNSLSLERDTLKRSINKTMESFESLQVKPDQHGLPKVKKTTPFQSYQLQKKKDKDKREKK